MKKFFTLILVLAAVFAAADARTFSIQPSKQQKKLTYKVEAFDEINISAALTVNYEQADAYVWSVSVQGAENVVPYVSVSVRRGKLTLRMKDSVNLLGDAKIKVSVTAPRIHEIDICGVSVFNAKALGAVGDKLELDASGASVINIDHLKASMADVEVSGASRVTLKAVTAHTLEAEFCGSSVATLSKVKVNDLEVEVGGASVCTLSGSADNVVYEASGASRLHAGGLKAANGKLRSSGASTLEARVANVLERKSTTSSVITLK